MPRKLSFFGYYWTCLKYFGKSIVETKLEEFISVLVLTIVTFFVGYMFGERGILREFEIGVTSLLGWLAIFAAYRLIRSPYSLYKNEDIESEAINVNWRLGVVGLIFLMVIAGPLVGLGWWTSAEYQRPLVVRASDPGAKDAEITRLKTTVESLQPVPELRNSLRRRTFVLVDKLRAFNQERNTGEPQKTGIDAAELANRKASYREQTRQLYAKPDGLLTETLRILQEYRKAGVDIGLLEVSTTQHPLNDFPSGEQELKELMCLTYQVDGLGHKIPLGK
jgi:hypothetical protein